jgi:hypothetical protein
MEVQHKDAEDLPGQAFSCRSLSRGVAGLGLLLITTSAVGDATSHVLEEKRRAAFSAEMEREYYIQKRVNATRPWRREGPLRAENLTDDEVREIQAAVTAVRPGTIVNIGAVVTGCPCEDGPSCTDQVWVVAYRPEKSTGFNLSKVDHHWVLGAAQIWWLEYEKLQASRQTFASWAAYFDAEQKLFERFPACPESNLPAAQSPAIAPAFPLIAR